MALLRKFDRQRDVILIDGDRAELLRLADRLEALEDRRAPALHIHELPGMRVYGGVHLAALAVGGRQGVRRVPDPLNQYSFEIGQSPEGWLEAADKTRAVAGAEGGSNWWDTLGVEEAGVMVTRGGYRESVWDRLDS